MTRGLRATRWIASLLLTVALMPVDANAIPAFARKYRTTCATCHAPFPRLTPFGETFAGNGFVMPGAPRSRSGMRDPRRHPDLSGMPEFFSRMLFA